MRFIFLGFIDFSDFIEFNEFNRYFEQILANLSKTEQVPESERERESCTKNKQKILKV